MKFNFFLLLLVLVLTSKSFAQQKNMVAVSYGFGTNALFRSTNGGASFDGKGEMSFNFSYQRKLVRALGLETGIYYSVNKLESTSEFYPGITRRVTTQNVKMISVPVFVNIYFLKYLYSNIGLTADFENGRSSNAIAPNQSGVGFGLGIGGRYNFNNFTVFVNPILQQHRLVEFQSDGSGWMMSASIKTGIGYRF